MSRGETPEIAGEEKEETAQKSSLARAMEGIASTFGGEEKKDDKPRFSITADNLLPKIRRGLLKEEEKEDAVVVGWRADVRSRKEREEALRYVKAHRIGLQHAEKLQTHRFVLYF
ncbi:MAG: hypothetical protein SGILL_004622 [Bacillariaceae sp.]